MENKKERIGYIEWMMKIKSNYQYHSHLARGLDHLVNSEPVKLPKGIRK